jgi:hypothetical protein
LKKALDKISKEHRQEEQKKTNRITLKYKSACHGKSSIVESLPCMFKAVSPNCSTVRYIINTLYRAKLTFNSEKPICRKEKKILQNYILQDINIHNM